MNFVCVHVCRFGLKGKVDATLRMKVREKEKREREREREERYMYMYISTCTGY